MRPCAKHWTEMRLAVHDRGMSHLVTENGEEVLARAVREMEALQEGEKLPAADFDPLMAMHWNFCGRVLERRGLVVIQDRGTEADGMPENRDEQGFNHTCPLCLVQRDFEAHNTVSGRCGRPECTVQVAPGEPSWERTWIENCADSMLQAAVELGLIKSQ